MFPRRASRHVPLLVFGVVSFKYKTQADWSTNITLAINNFKARWPSVLT